MVQWTWLTILIVIAIKLNIIDSAIRPKSVNQYAIKRISYDPLIYSMEVPTIPQNEIDDRGRQHRAKRHLESAVRPRRCHTASQRLLQKFQIQPLDEINSDEAVETAKRDTNATYGYHHHYPHATVPAFQPAPKKDLNALKEYLGMMQRLQHDAYNNLQNKLKDTITKMNQPWRDDHQVTHVEKPLPYVGTDPLWPNGNHYATGTKWHYPSKTTPTAEPNPIYPVNPIPPIDQNLHYLQNVPIENHETQTPMTVKTEQIKAEPENDESTDLPTIVLPQNSENTNFDNSGQFKKEIVETRNTEGSFVDQTPVLEKTNIPVIVHPEQLAVPPVPVQNQIETKPEPTTVVTQIPTTQPAIIHQKKKIMQEKMEILSEKQKALDDLVARILNIELKEENKVSNYTVLNQNQQAAHETTGPVLQEMGKMEHSTEGDHIAQIQENAHVEQFDQPGIHQVSQIQENSPEQQYHLHPTPSTQDKPFTQQYHQVTQVQGNSRVDQYHQPGVHQVSHFPVNSLEQQYHQTNLHPTPSTREKPLTQQYHQVTPVQGNSPVQQYHQPSVYDVSQVQENVSGQPYHQTNLYPTTSTQEKPLTQQYQVQGNSPVQPNIQEEPSAQEKPIPQHQQGPHQVAQAPEKPHTQQYYQQGAHQVPLVQENPLSQLPQQPNIQRGPSSQEKQQHSKNTHQVPQNKEKSSPQQSPHQVPEYHENSHPQQYHQQNTHQTPENQEKQHPQQYHQQNPHQLAQNQEKKPNQQYHQQSPHHITQNHENPHPQQYHPQNPHHLTQNQEKQHPQQHHQQSTHQVPQNQEKPHPQQYHKSNVPTTQQPTKKQIQDPLTKLYQKSVEQIFQKAFQKKRPDSSTKKSPNFLTDTIHNIVEDTLPENQIKSPNHHHHLHPHHAFHYSSPSQNQKTFNEYSNPAPTTEPYHVVLLKDQEKKKKMLAKPMVHNPSTLNSAPEEPYKIVRVTTTTPSPDERLIKLLAISGEPEFVAEIKKEMNELKKCASSETCEAESTAKNETPTDIEKSEEKIIIPFNENEKKVIVLDPNDMHTKQIHFVESPHTSPPHYSYESVEKHEEIEPEVEEYEEPIEIETEPPTIPPNFPWHLYYPMTQNVTQPANQSVITTTPAPIKIPNDYYQKAAEQYAKLVKEKEERYKNLRENLKKPLKSRKNPIYKSLPTMKPTKYTPKNSLSHTENYQFDPVHDTLTQYPMNLYNEIPEKRSCQCGAAQNQLGNPAGCSCGKTNTPNQSQDNVKAQKQIFSSSNDCSSETSSDYVESSKPSCGCHHADSDSIETKTLKAMKHTCACGHNHDDCDDLNSLRAPRSQPEPNKYDILNSMLLWLKRFGNNEKA